METKEKFEFRSEVLKQEREKRGYKQDELAKLVYTTRQSISNWENGKKVPTLENVNRLATTLGITIDDLIVRKVEEKQNTNDERMDENVTYNYSLVCKPNLISRIKNSKIVKIILIILLIILLIYLGNSVRKFVILTNIRRKASQYEDIDNYHYVKTYYKVDNLECITYYTETVYFKDGISKTKYYDGHETNILYEDENQTLLIYEDTEEYEILDKKSNKNINFLKNIFSEPMKNDIIVNLIYSLNPLFHIETMENQYVIKFKIKENNNRIIENISVDGLLKEKYVYYSDNDYEKTIYEIKLDGVNESDLNIALDTYRIK